MPNLLAASTSPYLLQHADNPVHWQEWGEAAFTEARERDVPVLLSVGYAACHWCHVMAHESFEDEQVATFLNERFVAVKVDREERPDIDAVYMSATQALTGRGGWPMTCLLTPDAEPFYCGTYFPKQQFLQLLDGAHRAWTGSREDVLESGGRITERLREMSTPPPAQPLTPDVLSTAVKVLSRQFDSVRGGFGQAPKFPPSMVLEFLIRHHARTGSPEALAMVERTCEAMARGGMYDQLAGGFARYSVDADWVVPHFEKMLYDNALLLRVYVHLFRLTGDPFARRIATETADFMLRDLRTPKGALASALDADAVVDGHNVEGVTYAWTPAQLVEVLGEEDGRRAADLLSVTDSGTFEHGSSTLQLLTDPDDPSWWAGVRERLLAARAPRPQPARDDKVVTAWNGLAVAALADAAVVLGERRYQEAAAEIAGFLTEHHLVDGRLRRTSRGGVVGSAAAVSDDHGDLAEGLLALHQADSDPTWLRAAGSLLDTALERFGDPDGGFHDTADDAETLVTRPRALGDNAEPSGQSALAGALLTHAALTGRTDHREAAERALAATGTIAAREPRFAGWSLAVAEALAVGPLEVALVADEDGTGLEQLYAVVRASTSPGLVVVRGAVQAEDTAEDQRHPLLADRPLVGGRATAYVCRGFVCDAPVTTADQLRTALST